jgi:hypothetical protein
MCTMGGPPMVEVVQARHGWDVRGTGFGLFWKHLKDETDRNYFSLDMTGEKFARWEDGFSSCFINSRPRLGPRTWFDSTTVHRMQNHGRDAHDTYVQTN